MPFMFDPCQPCCRPDNYVQLQCCEWLSHRPIVIRNPDTNEILFEGETDELGRFYIGQRTDPQYLVTVYMDYGEATILVTMGNRTVTVNFQNFIILVGDAKYTAIGNRLCCGTRQGLVLKPYQLDWSFSSFYEQWWFWFYGGSIVPAFDNVVSVNTTTEMAYRTLPPTIFVPRTRIMWTSPWQILASKNPELPDPPDPSNDILNLWIRWSMECVNCSIKVYAGFYNQWSPERYPPETYGISHPPTDDNIPGVAPSSPGFEVGYDTGWFLCNRYYYTSGFAVSSYVPLNITGERNYWMEAVPSTGLACLEGPVTQEYLANLNFNIHG